MLCKMEHIKIIVGFKIIVGYKYKSNLLMLNKIYKRVAQKSSNKKCFNKIIIKKCISQKNCISPYVSTLIFNLL